MVPQVQPVGIATIKPKRKYTRKPKLGVVKQVKPKVRQELPKTARAYLRTLGVAADKEGTAIKELIKMHHALSKAKEVPAIEIPDPFLNITAPVKEEPKSFLRRWFVGYGK